MLATLIVRAKTNGHVKGVVPHLVGDGLSIMQYVDDTILFVDHDMLQAKKLKLALSTFEQISGLKINFHKSELFCYGTTKDCEMEYTQLFGCRLCDFPFKYLGIPRNLGLGMHRGEVKKKNSLVEKINYFQLVGDLFLSIRY